MFLVADTADDGHSIPLSRVLMMIIWMTKAKMKRHSMGDIPEWQERLCQTKHSIVLARRIPCSPDSLPSGFLNLNLSYFKFFSILHLKIKCEQQTNLIFWININSDQTFLFCRSSCYRVLPMLTQLSEIQNSQNGSTRFSSWTRGRHMSSLAR